MKMNPQALPQNKEIDILLNELEEMLKFRENTVKPTDSIILKQENNKMCQNIGKKHECNCQKIHITPEYRHLIDFWIQKQNQKAELSKQFTNAIDQIRVILSTKDIKITKCDQLFAGIKIQTPCWVAKLDLIEFVRKGK